MPIIDSTNQEKLKIGSDILIKIKYLLFRNINIKKIKGGFSNVKK